MLLAGCKADILHSKIYVENEENYTDERCSAMLQRVIVAVLVDRGQKWDKIGVP